MAGLVSLAGWVRGVLDATVVGVTGSTGKTSVKDLLASIVMRRMPVIASEKSFNNELGVPLTLLKTTEDTRVVVVEMGARGVGQIEQLCTLARPHIGIVTNVGVTHFELFGSQAAIAQAKGELVEALPEGGAAILNADDPLVAAMSGRRGQGCGRPYLRHHPECVAPGRRGPVRPTRPADLPVGPGVAQGISGSR